MSKRKDYIQSNLALLFNIVKSGDIFYTCDNSIISKVIRYVETGGNLVKVPSHCGIITDIYSSNNRIYVNIIEMRYNGAWKGQIDIYLRKNTKLWISRINEPKNTEKGLIWAFNQQGKKYAYWQLGAIFILAFLRWINIKRKRWDVLLRYLNERKTFICSEFVVRYTTEAGQTLKEGSPDFITPLDLYYSNKQIFIDSK